MYYVIDVQVCQTTEDLRTKLLCWLNDVRSIRLLEVRVHVLSVQNFNESVDLEFLADAVVFVHKILVIDHIWVLQVLANVEFCKHLAKSFLRLFQIIQDLSALVAHACTE